MRKEKTIAIINFDWLSFLNLKASNIILNEQYYVIYKCNKSKIWPLYSYWITVIKISEIIHDYEFALTK